MLLYNNYHAATVAASAGSFAYQSLLLQVCSVQLIIISGAETHHFAQLIPTELKLIIANSSRRAETHHFEQELNISQEKASRRWIARSWLTSSGKNDSVMLSAEGCLIACLNNYVWIDTSTGLFPSQKRTVVSGVYVGVLQARYACIRCSSSYLAVAASVAPNLYSVWNFSGGLSPFSSASLALAASSTALGNMQVGLGCCFSSVAVP